MTVMNVITKRILGTLLLCLPMAAAAVCAQVAYKGQLYISEERFQRQGDMLHVYMKVSYDDSAIGSGESLTFTPVLKTDSTAVHLSSVVINGYRNEKAARREEALSRKRRGNIAVVVKEKHTGKRYFIYDTSLPYKEWMEKSALYIESEECNCNGHRAHLYEDRLLAAIPLGKAPLEISDPLVKSGALLSWVEFLQLGKDEGETFSTQRIIPFYGERHIGDLNEKKQNKAVFEALASDIRETIQHYGTTLTGISVKGYGAPIGDYHKNEIKSMKRALSLKRYLMTNPLTSKNALDVSWVSEDWDSIASLTATSGMALKEAVLDIIRTVDVVGGREKVLENLNQGAPYLYMKQNIFPRVYRVGYTLTFNRRAMDAQTARLMLKNNPNTMSLSDFYTVAMTYKAGTREFDDVMDLAARLFPDNAEANINAAAVALTRHDTALARKYLEQWQTDPKAYNNMGVLYLLEGNRDKAEVYLQMAYAAGVKQAQEVLKCLKK